MARREGVRATIVRRAWRLGAWSLITLLSVAAAVITAYTETGSRRLALGEAPFRPTAAAPAVSDNEERRLADALRALSADRDRLAARVSALERNLDDVTGSIANRNGPERGGAPGPAASPLPPSLAPAPPAAAATVRHRSSSHPHPPPSGRRRKLPW
jgi:hypothetical protein